MNNVIKISIMALLTTCTQNIFAERVGYGWCEGFYGPGGLATNRVYTQVFTIPVPVKDHAAMVKAFDNTVLNKAATVNPPITESGLRVINSSKCVIGEYYFEKDLEHYNYVKSNGGLGKLHITKWLPVGAKIHPTQQ